MIAVIVHTRTPFLFFLSSADPRATPHSRPAIPIALHRSIRIPASTRAVRTGCHQPPTTPRTTVNTPIRRRRSASAQNPHRAALPIMSLRVARRALLALVASLLCLLAVSSAHGADVASPSRPHALFIAIPLPVGRRRCSAASLHAHCALSEQPLTARRVRTVPAGETHMAARSPRSLWLVCVCGSV